MGPLTLTRAAQTTSSAGRKQRATGERWVRVLSLIAFTISTWMLLTLAGGTRMFVQRVGEPSAALRAAEAELGDSLSKGYVFMAMFASLLLIPTLLELLTQATRANLAGREQHLATLRLLGASARDVRGMMLIDALRQALIGLTLGTAIYLVSVPAWSRLSFQEQQIGMWELFAWWLIPVVWVVVLLLAAASVWRALTRVSVTPLGVTKRIPPKGQSVVATALAAVAVGITLFGLKQLEISPDSDTAVYVGGLAFLGFNLLFSAMMVVGLIQLTSRLSYRLPPAANYVATRRVGRGAKTTWNRVSAMYFVAFTAGTASQLPRMDAEGTMMMERLLAADLPTGTAITVTFGAVLMVVFTLLTQSIAVVEQQQLTRSLYFIGAPAAFHTRVAVREVGVPLTAVAVLGFALGVLVGSVVVAFGSKGIGQLVLFSVLVIASLIASVVAVYATGPLRQRVLEETGRLND